MVSEAHSSRRTSIVRRAKFSVFAVLSILLGYVALVYGAPAITYNDPTPSDNATSYYNWTYVNITSSEVLNRSLLEWGNASESANVSMTNGSITNLTWYVNMTGLSAGAYNYTIWAQNLTGDWNQSARRYAVIGAISACQNLTLGNVGYILIQNISSAGTCFNILANNITIDGAGYTANYSQSSAGYGINSSGYNNTVIKNLTIVQGSLTSGSHAVYILGMESGTIANNTVQTIGSASYGIFLDTAGNSNIISGNRIITSNTTADGLRINYSNSTTISNNNITVSGAGAYGILLISSVGNTITGGSISGQYGDYYLSGSGATNTFRNTNFTSMRNISFQDTSSYFRYNNETSGSIWLTTNVSAASNLTRVLINWNSSAMQWNDTSTVGLNATYNITGLTANAIYYVYTASGGVQNKSSAQTADSSGNLPVFSAALNGNTEIIFDRVPNITIVSPANASYNGTVSANITVDEAASWCGFTLNTTGNTTLANTSANMTLWANSSISLPNEGQYNITFWCNDTRGNIGNSSVLYFTRDTIKPNITSISSNTPGSTTATISWSTNELASGIVYYGTSTDTTSNATHSGNATYHSVPLSGLTASTTYYYNVSSCDLAGNCNTSLQSSFTTAAASNSSSTSSSSSSSSSSTSGLSKTWASLATGATASMTISSSSVDVTYILFTASQSATNVQLTVAKISGTPPGVSSTPPGTVYQYFSIVTANITDSKISSASITFRVNSTWMSQNDIDSSTVTLYRYSGGQWNALSTYSAKGSTSTYTNYAADTPGFSNFAIVAQKKSATVSPSQTPANLTQSSGNTTRDINATSNNASQSNETSAENTASSSSRSGYWIVLLIAIAIAVVSALVYYAKPKSGDSSAYRFKPSEKGTEGLVYKKQPEKEPPIKYSYKPDKKK